MDRLVPSKSCKIVSSFILLSHVDILTIYKQAHYIDLHFSTFLISTSLSLGINSLAQQKHKAESELKVGNAFTCQHPAQECTSSIKDGPLIIHEQLSTGMQMSNCLSLGWTFLTQTTTT